MTRKYFDTKEDCISSLAEKRLVSKERVRIDSNGDVSIANGNGCREHWGLYISTENGKYFIDSYVGLGKSAYMCSS
jgi:hypothetical protein